MRFRQAVVMVSGKEEYGNGDWILCQMDNSGWFCGGDAAVLDGRQSMGRSASKKCFSSNADVKPNEIKNISKKCFSSHAWNVTSFSSLNKDLFFPIGYAFSVSGCWVLDD